MDSGFNLRILSKMISMKQQMKFSKSSQDNYFIVVHNQLFLTSEATQMSGFSKKKLKTN